MNKKQTKKRIRKTISLPQEFWDFLEVRADEELHGKKSFIIQKLIKKDMTCV